MPDSQLILLTTIIVCPKSMKSVQCVSVRAASFDYFRNQIN